MGYSPPDVIAWSCFPVQLRGGLLVPIYLAGRQYRHIALGQHDLRDARDVLAPLILNPGTVR